MEMMYIQMPSGVLGYYIFVTEMGNGEGGLRTQELMSKTLNNFSCLQVYLDALGVLLRSLVRAEIRSGRRG